MRSLQHHVEECLNCFGLPGGPKAAILYWPFPSWLESSQPNPIEIGDATDFQERYERVVETGISWMNVSLVGYTGRSAIVEIELPSYTAPNLSNQEPAVPFSGMTRLVLAKSGQVSTEELQRRMPVVAVEQLVWRLGHSKI
jgi:hypothetical protein